MSEIEGRAKYLSDEEKRNAFHMSDEDIEESDRDVAEEAQQAAESKKQPSYLERAEEMSKDVIEKLKSE